MQLISHFQVTYLQIHTLLSEQMEVAKKKAKRANLKLDIPKRVSFKGPQQGKKKLLLAEAFEKVTAGEKSDAKVGYIPIFM